MKKTDDKITLVNIIFNLNACKNLSKKELDALSDTASNFFHFVQAFGNKQQAQTKGFFKYMHGRRQGARPRFCNVWSISDLLL